MLIHAHSADPRPGRGLPGQERNASGSSSDGEQRRLDEVSEGGGIFTHCPGKTSRAGRRRATRCSRGCRSVPGRPPRPDGEAGRAETDVERGPTERPRAHVNAECGGAVAGQRESTRGMTNSTASASSNVAWDCENSGIATRTPLSEQETWASDRGARILRRATAELRTSTGPNRGRPPRTCRRSTMRRAIVRRSPYRPATQASPRST